MKTHAKQSIELDHLNLTPEAKTEVSNLDSITAYASTKRAQTAGSEESGTEAGTGTFARIRFGAKSEALSQPQFSLFEEDWQTDVAAIEAEIEQLLLPVPQKPSVHALGANLCRITCHASNTAMNRNPANADSAAAI
ncbi:MAG: transposase [Nitrosomonas sp.]|nr:transposase [Nitrosomonas sp.]